jgi:flagellin-like protein
MRITKKEKKGLSPVIATVLLVAIVVVIGLIIFIWARGFITESGTKLGKNARQNCDEINLEASLDGTSLSVSNNGQVPLYGAKLEQTLAGSTTVSETGKKLGPGSSDVYELDDSYESVKIVPIILVEKKGAREPYTCESYVKQVTAGA